MDGGARKRKVVIEDHGLGVENKSYSHLMPNDIDTSGEVIDQSVPITVYHLLHLIRPSRISIVLPIVH